MRTLRVAARAPSDDDSVELLEPTEDDDTRIDAYVGQTLVGEVICRLLTPPEQKPAR